MARRELTGPSLRSVGIRRALYIRYRMTPWWLRVLAIWLASRVVTTGILLWFAAKQPDNPWTRASPDYFSFAQLWDSTWYHIVAVVGYPSELPMNAAGEVTENAWAFMPGYPLLVRLIMIATGLPWAPISVIVSIGFSFGAALICFRMFRLVLESGTSLFAVAIVCFAPLSPILQVSYAESMYIFLLALALYLLMQRRYLLLIPVIAVMAITRPSGLAFALTLCLHFVYRLMNRKGDSFPSWEKILLIGVTVFSGLMGLAWPFLAWIYTGRFSAYTDTELAWRAPYLGHRQLIPFTPWFEGAQFWIPGALGTALLIALIIAFFASLLLPATVRLGSTLRIWLASYGIYLLAVFFPQSSTFRLLMPMFPLAGALAAPKSLWYRLVLILLLIAGQWAWCYACWWYDGYDSTPP